MASGDPAGGKADQPGSKNPSLCCDPEEEPISIDGAHCCADGSWARDIGNGDPSVCDDAGGVGLVCE